MALNSTPIVVKDYRGGVVASNSTPKVIKDYRERFLFGLVSIKYLVENRRPDIADGSYNYGHFKHFLTVRILWKSLRWTYRTMDRYAEQPYRGRDGTTPGIE